VVRRVTRCDVRIGGSKRILYFIRSGVYCVLIRDYVPVVRCVVRVETRRDVSPDFGRVASSGDRRYVLNILDVELRLRLSAGSTGHLRNTFCVVTRSVRFRRIFAVICIGFFKE